MIRYLLDTDVVSQASKRRENANAAAWLRSVSDRDLAISVVTLRERWEGAWKAERLGSPHAADIAADIETMLTAFRGRILGIDERVARRWAALLVPDRSKADDKCQIAIAAIHGLTLVSLNTRDMQGQGVPLLNPGRNPPKAYPA